MEKQDVLVGGAWPYANYYLHVGHLAALLPGDVIAKHYREKGDNVIYVLGSNCLGIPITERARKEITDLKNIAYFYHNENLKTFNIMNFEYDLHFMTLSEKHINFVQDEFKIMFDKDCIYTKEEVGVYCDNCNKLLPDDSNIIKTIINLKDHGWKEETNSRDFVLDNVDILYKRIDEKFAEEKNKVKVLIRSKFI